MIDRPNTASPEDAWLMYQQEQWMEKNNWLAFTLGSEKPFTKSNGTLLARVYERLTKASRRRVKARKEEHYFPLATIKQEAAYRRGVYDTLKGLQKELT